MGYSINSQYENVSTIYQLLKFMGLYGLVNLPLHVIDLVITYCIPPAAAIWFLGPLSGPRTEAVFVSVAYVIRSTVEFGG